MHNIVALKEY